MHFKRTIAVATVFACSATTAANASARVYIPWTEQTVFALSPSDSYVAEWNGPSGGWTVIGGPATWLFAGADGLVAVGLNGTEDGYYYNGTPGSWTDISGPMYGYAVGANTVYRVDENRDVLSVWNGGTSWTPILSVGIDDLLDPLAGDAGLYVGYETSDAGPEQYLEYDGTPNEWSYIGGSPTPMAVSRTSLYGVTDDGGGRVATVDLYSGSGTSWTVIGGPADPRLAAGD